MPKSSNYLYPNKEHNQVLSIFWCLAFRPETMHVMEDHEFSGWKAGHARLEYEMTQMTNAPVLRSCEISLQIIHLALSRPSDAYMRQ